MTIAVILACLVSPNLDACLQATFHGPGPKVELVETARHVRHVQPFPRVRDFRQGDGICRETNYADGTITISCVG